MRCTNTQALFTKNLGRFLFFFYIKTPEKAMDRVGKVGPAENEVLPAPLGEQTLINVREDYVKNSFDSEK